MGKPIAYELPSTRPSYRHWVGILQPKNNPLDPMARDIAYVVMDFELAKAKMEEYFADHDMVNMQRSYHRSKDELFTFLEEKGYDLKAFTYPWKCDFPFS